MALSNELAGLRLKSADRGRVTVLNVAVPAACTRLASKHGRWWPVPCCGPVPCIWNLFYCVVQLPVHSRTLRRGPHAQCVRSVGEVLPVRVAACSTQSFATRRGLQFPYPSTRMSNRTYLTETETHISPFPSRRLRHLNLTSLRSGPAIRACRLDSRPLGKRLRRFGAARPPFRRLAFVVGQYQRLGWLSGPNFHISII